MPGPASDPTRVDEQLRRLLPLLPQLAIGIQRRRGTVPPELQEAGSLGPRHIAALVSLAVEGPASVSELAQRLNMTLTHASLVVRELHKAGVLTRRSDDADHRRIIVSVIPERRAQIQRTAASAAEPIRRFLAGLSENDAEQFVVHLSQLTQALHEVT